MREGRLINTRGRKRKGQARYVRLYSRGNTSDPQNQYIEVEVIGQAAQKSHHHPPPMVEYKPTLPITPSQKAPTGVKAPPLPRLMVPRDAKNLAYRKLVTSDYGALYGSMEQITDGQKDVWMTLDEGVRWVQIDLTVPMSNLRHPFVARLRRALCLPRRGDSSE